MVMHASAAVSRFPLTILIIAAGLASRSAVDKLLTLRGGAELVALWAQLSSVIEIVAGVAVAGVGTGLVVYIARAKQPERQRELLTEALKMGLKVALPVALAIGAAGYALSDPLTGGKVAPAVFALAATAGWIAVIPALINNYWMGRQDYGLMLGLCLASLAISLFALICAPQRFTLEFLTVSQALPVAVFLLLRTSRPAAVRFSRRPHPLRRYVLPGLAIGILSPVSMMVSRGSIGDSLSWHDAGVLQALFRVTDWVCALAAGILSLIYLPRFAAARSRQGLDLQIRDAARTTLLPAAIALAALGFAHRPLLELLYAPGVRASDTATALFFAGSLVRIAAWIPLAALYAMRRTREITIGELLSLPLFAALTLAAGRHLTLELAGAFWLISYSAYGAYNLRAMRGSRQKIPAP